MDKTIIEQIQLLISEKTGLKPRTDWPLKVGRFMETVCKEKQIASHNFQHLLHRDDSLLKQIISMLTVDESYFFRHEEQFEYLITFLSERFHRQPHNLQISIWSAGCSIGQEPLSIAMLIKEQFGGEILHRTKLVASDINSISISKAARGIYHPWSFRQTPSWVLDKYFARTEENNYSIDPKLNSHIFYLNRAIEDHVSIHVPSSLDVIFFRNVAIYLTLRHLDKLYNYFRQLLKPDGLLIIAPSDPGPPKQLFKRFPNLEVGFYKPCNRIEFTDHGKNGTCRQIKTKASPANKYQEELIENSDDIISVFELANRGFEEQALDSCNSILSGNSSSATYLLRGQLLLNKNQLSAAINDFNRVIELDPKHVIAQYWRIIALLQAGENNHAQKQISTLIRKLKLLPEKQILNDEKTTVGELLKATLSLAGIKS